MKIADAIKRADTLYPNLYSREEKLHWCYELTAMIYAEYKKTFNTITIAEGEELPPTILLEDIHEVWAGERKLEKTDDRNFKDLDFGEGEIKVIYQVRPEPYREESRQGTYAFGNVKLSEMLAGTGEAAEVNPDPEYGMIVAPGTEFFVHDLVEIVRDGVSQQRYVMEVRGDNYYFAEPFETVGEAEATLRRILTEETPMPPPYDWMYVDYLLGKIAFYQNDLQEYNKHMIDFNTVLDEYAKWYKQTNPLSETKFKNMW